MQSDGRLSLREIAKRCQLSLGGVKKICAALQNYGLIERVGSRRDGYWITRQTL